MSRCREPQLQVGNNSYILQFQPKHMSIWRVWFSFLLQIIVFANKKAETCHRRDQHLIPFRAGTVFIRQSLTSMENLTSVDRRFWRIKAYLELTKTFMMMSNWTKPFGLYGLYKNISSFKGLTYQSPQYEDQLWPCIRHVRFNLM